MLCTSKECSINSYTLFKYAEILVFYQLQLVKIMLKNCSHSTE